MKKNLLVVDDSAFMRRIICDIIIQIKFFKQQIIAEMVLKHMKNLRQRAMMV